MKQHLLHNTQIMDTGSGLLFCVISTSNLTHSHKHKHADGCSSSASKRNGSPRSPGHRRPPRPVKSHSTLTNAPNGSAPPPPHERPTARAPQQQVHQQLSATAAAAATQTQQLTAAAAVPVSTNTGTAAPAPTSYPSAQLNTQLSAANSSPAPPVPMLRRVASSHREYAMSNAQQQRTALEQEQNSGSSMSRSNSNSLLMKDSGNISPHTTPTAASPVTPSAATQGNLPTSSSLSPAAAAAGCREVPQSPRRMDGKAPGLSSSSAALFCADNASQAPTTPQSFCSSTCMPPFTSSTSSTPDYAAAAANPGVCVFKYVCLFVCIRGHCRLFALSNKHLTCTHSHEHTPPTHINTLLLLSLITQCPSARPPLPQPWNC